MDGLAVELKLSGHIVAARQAARELARELGFGSADQTRLATAVSELARNAIEYAEEGVCIVTDVSDDETAIIRVVVEDHGPGIVDIDKAMQNGYTTSGGLGAGLPGSRRLAHEFSISSEPGHTVVQLIMKRKRA